MSTKSLRTASEEEEVKKNTVANLLLLLSHGVTRARKHIHEHRTIFECKTCYKQFPSFQALGGHCTTHKRPAAAGEPDGVREAAARATKKARTRRRIHECAVCGAEFGTGQALGGHMRRHKFAAAAATEDFLRRRDDDQGRAGEGRLLLLDLNLPPPEDDLDLKDLALWCRTI